jgi:hypothetical protein
MSNRSSYPEGKKEGDVDEPMEHSDDEDAVDNPQELDQSGYQMVLPSGRIMTDCQLHF